MARTSKTHITVLLENRVYPDDVRVDPHVSCLRESGYDVTVVCPGIGKGFSRYEVINGVRVYRFPLIVANKTLISYFVEGITGVFFLTFMTFWVWVRHGMDILLVYNPPDVAFVAGLIPKMMGKTIVFDVRDIAPELYQAKFRVKESFVVSLLRGMEYLSCRVADHVVTVNESYRELLQTRNRIPVNRISVIRQGPDLDLIRPTEPDPALRNRASTILAYLGNMSSQDGVDHLLYALQKLDMCNGHRDWLCLLIGQADDPEYLKELASKLGIADRVWYTGYVSREKWVQFLSTADICVEPAPANAINSISTMNKIMDYMALSKPCVAYDLPEHRVTAADSALFARPNDPEDLARLISYLIEHPEERERLGVLGRERIEKELALKYQKSKLQALFERLADR